MYPTSGVASSKTFDLTLMICLLRNLASIDVGDKLPHPSVISEAAELSRLKYYRNKFAHHDGCILTFKDFELNWNEICQAIHGLGGPQFTQICQDVKDMTLNNNDKEILIEIRNLEKSSTFVPKALQKIHEDLINEWGNEDNKVVKTRAISRIEELLKYTDVVVAVGPSGCGKSTAIHHVALWLHNQEGYTIVPVHSPEEIISYCKPTYKQVFVIDDVCGISTIDIGLVNRWTTWAIDIEQVIADHKIKILLSCRKHIYLDRSFAGVELLSKTACDLVLSYRLTEIERNQIASIYLTEREINALKKSNLDKKFSFFPLLCSLYSKQKVTTVQNFFAYPISVLGRDLNLLRKATDQTTLATMSLFIAFNNNLDKNMLVRSNDMTELLEAISDHFYLPARFSIKVVTSELHKLEMSYVKKTVSTYRILHDRIYDIFLAFCGEHFFDLVLEVAHRDVIRDRLVLESVLKEDQNLINEQNVITVPDKVEDHYFDRIVKDIKKISILHVFDNRQLKCITFRKKLFLYIEQRLDIREMLSALSVCEISNILLSMTSQFYWDLVPILLTKHVDVNVSDWRGTPLYLASKQGHIENAKILLDHHADPSICNEKNEPPLFVASEEGQTEIVRSLLKHKCNPNICNKSKKSPVFIASSRGYFDIVRLLLEHKCDPKLCDDLNTSPLFIASAGGYTAIVKLLLEHNCDPNVCNDYPMSPLFVATLNGYIDIIRLLLEHNCDPNVCDRENMSPLFVASEYRLADIVRLLLEYKCDPNICNRHNMSPLFVASTCKSGYDIVKLLLEYKCDPNICNCQNMSPLFVASRCKGCYDIVKLLLQYKCDPNICNNQNISPLFVASQNEHVDIIRLLLENNSDPNKCNNKNESPLLIASSKGNHDIAKLLLKHKCNSHVNYDNRESPLMIASSEGYTNIVRLLLEHKCDPNLCRCLGMSPLFAASANGHIDIVRILLDHNCDPRKSIPDRNHLVGTMSPSYIASLKGYIDVVGLLIEHKCDPNIYDSEKWMPPVLHASVRGHTDMVKLLLEQNCDPNICNDKHESALFIASYRGHTDIVRLLLQNNCDPDICNHINRSPLFIALQEGHIQIVKLLL
ncbi:uncharacterized protein LOC134694064 [Mytilus trossulus]|uniref:uncharacterized protein LOC134694064 n=1 Tax=Mytilus trossulus TaxID=6551 RepID=UPI0030050FBA